MIIRFYVHGTSRIFVTAKRSVRQPGPSSVESDCFSVCSLVKYKEGPLSVLYNSIEKKAKLRVWTRKLKGLRGVCVGYLVAFDKHMNLVSVEFL